MHLLFVAVLYFIPTVIAVIRDHHNKVAIAVLNTFLGWTFIGWVAALVWSVTANKNQPNPDWRRLEQQTQRREVVWDAPVADQKPQESPAPPQFQDESDTDYLARLRRLGHLGK